MANQCLLLVGLFGQWAHDEDKNRKQRQAADDTFVVFAFFLFAGSRVGTQPFLFVSSARVGEGAAALVAYRI